MRSPSTPALAPDSGRASTATRLVFFFAGFVLASWAPLIPLTRIRLGLNDAELGGLLLWFGLGSVTTMGLSGGLAARFGCRRVILVAASLVSACLPALAVAPTALTLGAVLFVMGAGIGTVDVVMNIQAVIVEKAAARPMMSGFHGLFSVGGLAGAVCMTSLLTLGASPFAALTAFLAVSIGLLVASARGLLPFAGEDRSVAFAVPRGRVVLIGALCCVVFLAEGAVADWSGVLLNTVRGLDKNQAGVGYVAFALAMTAGRLAGDKLVSRLGAERTLVFGSVTGAVGFALAALAPSWPASSAGFLLVGVGAANIVPVLFTAAGRQRSMPSNLAVAAVTTMGYAGVLVGPAVIGVIAKSTSLPTAVLLLAAALAGVALLARRAVGAGV